MRTGLALVAALLCARAALPQAAPLTFCMEQDSWPFSSREPRGGGGLDFELARALTRELDRPLRVHWYRASDEEEFSAPLQLNWLLSSGACDVTASFPLTRDALDPPPIRELLLPAADGERSRVRLGRIRASRPYWALVLTLVATPNHPDVRSLDQAAGLRLAVERESLADAVAMVYGGARLRDATVKLPAERDALFETLGSGGADVGFIELHRFETYRRQAPGTPLLSTGYVHPLAVNVGLAAVDPRLLHEVDSALGRVIASGKLQETAERLGLTYHPPHEPAVLPYFTPRVLSRR